jgi:hypothetical protein
MQLDEFFDKVCERLGLSRPVLHLDHPLATELVTLQTNRRIEMVIPQAMLSARVSETLGGVAGEGLGVPKGKLLSNLVPGAVSGHKRLIDLGIPSGHIVRLREGSKRYYVELSGDLAGTGNLSGLRQLSNPWFEFRPE